MILSWNLFADGKISDYDRRSVEKAADCSQKEYHIGVHPAQQAAKKYGVDN